LWFCISHWPWCPRIAGTNLLLSSSHCIHSCIIFPWIFFIHHIKNVSDNSLRSLWHWYSMLYNKFSYNGWFLRKLIKVWSEFHLKYLLIAAVWTKINHNLETTALTITTRFLPFNHVICWMVRKRAWSFVVSGCIPKKLGHGVVLKSRSPENGYVWQFKLFHMPLCIIFICECSVWVITMPLLVIILSVIYYLYVQCSKVHLMFSWFVNQERRG
jgi:hypothetical protein